MKPEKIKVFVAIPTVNTVADVQPYILRDIEKKYGDRIEFHYPPVCIRRIFHDAARNGLVQEFLDSECDVIWFLDSDVVPMRHVMDLITEHWDKWQVAGAPYPVFMGQRGEEGPQIVFTAYKGTVANVGMAACNVPDSGTDFVDGLATGCMFIKREVFEKINQPWFEFKYHPESRALTEGEDLGFCLKLQKLGIKFFTDYSMTCKHYKYIDLLDANNYAITYAKKSVESYDAMIKEKVTKAVKAAYDKGFNDARAQLGERQRATKSGLILP